LSSPTWRPAAACSPFSPAAVSPVAEPITWPPRLHRAARTPPHSPTTSPQGDNHRRPWRPALIRTIAIPPPAPG
jgi:hypothetical protein